MIVSVRKETAVTKYFFLLQKTNMFSGVVRENATSFMTE